MDRECCYADAAEALKCSETKVRDFVDAGQIRIVRRERPAGQHGRVWLNAEDVERMAATWKRQRRPPERGSPATDRRIDGRIAAQAYRMFSESASDASVVIKLELDPLLVRRLRSLYEQTPEREAAERKAREERQRELDDKKEHDRRTRQAERDKLEMEKARIAARATIEAAERAARVSASRRSTT